MILIEIARGWSKTWAEGANIHEVLLQILSSGLCRNGLAELGIVR